MFLLSPYVARFLRFESSLWDFLRFDCLFLVAAFLSASFILGLLLLVICHVHIFGFAVVAVLSFGVFACMVTAAGEAKASSCDAGG